MKATLSIVAALSAVLLSVSCSNHGDRGSQTADSPATADASAGGSGSAPGAAKTANPASPATEENIQATAWRMIQTGAFLVDVRTPEEFKRGHLEGAVNIPYDQVENRRAEFGAVPDRAIVVYCRTGRRSGIAQTALEAMGYTNVFNGGGLDALQKARSANAPR